MPAMKTLYYISTAPLELLTPRTTENSYENQTVPRICLNDSIEGCLISRNENQAILGKQFKVYTVETNNYYKPTLSEVPNRDITGELWVQFAVEPDYLYDIEVIGQKGEIMVESAGNMIMLPKWDYRIVKTKSLQEDTRTVLVAKSKNVGPYKDQMRGKNRFERKKHSQIAKTVKQYNKIDMDKFFKQDILEVSIPVVGETDSYTVKVRFEGVVSEIARNIKNNKNRLEFKTIVQSLTKIFNTANIYVKCSCPDYKYRFAHWNIINRVSTDDTASDPGPGKGIRNPNDQLGRGCKHVLLVLANGDWIMKVASVINNYINYAEEKLQKPFIKFIFPKLYGVSFDEATDNDLLPNDFKLDTNTSIIDTINDYGKNRGKMLKGSNINPVYADRLSAEQSKKPVADTNAKQTATTASKKESEPEAKKLAPESSKKPEDKKPSSETDKKASDKSKETKDEEDNKTN